MFNREQAVTALCIWEYFLECDSKNKDNIYYQLREHSSASDLRDTAIDIAPFVNKAYETISDEFIDSFDWEFVPSFLNHLAEQVNTSKIGTHDLIELLNGEAFTVALNGVKAEYGIIEKPLEGEFIRYAKDGTSALGQLADSLASS